MLIFGGFASTFGLFEEFVPYILVLIPIFLLLGYDVIIPAAIVLDCRSNPALASRYGASGDRTTPMETLPANFSAAGMFVMQSLLFFLFPLGADRPY